MTDTEFKGVHVLGTWVHGPGIFHTAGPVTVKRDLQGSPARTARLRLCRRVFDRHSSGGHHLGDLRRCFHANRRGRCGYRWHRANRLACRWLNPRHTGRQLFRHRQIYCHDLFHLAGCCVLQRVFGTDPSASGNQGFGGRSKVQPMGRADLNLGALPTSRVFYRQPVNDFANHPDFLAWCPRA